MIVTFERDRIHFADCLKMVKPKKNSAGDVAKALEEKNK